MMSIQKKNRNQLHAPYIIIGKTIKPPVKITKTATKVNDIRCLAKQLCHGFWCLEVDFYLLGYGHVYINIRNCSFLWASSFAIALF